MTGRQRTVLRAVATRREGVGRLRLVKLLFLMAQEHPRVPRTCRYEFVPFKHGPFSFTLYHELKGLVDEGYLQETDGLLTLTPLGTGEADAANPDVWIAIDRVATAHAHQDTEALLDDVYARYPWYTLNAERQDRRAAEALIAPLGVYTVGYEGRTLDGLLDLLLRRGVRRLIDVRANPVARRYGFHRSTLARLCPQVGVEYVHVPELGVPSVWREDLPDAAAYDALFRRYAEEVMPKAETALERVKTMLEEAPGALMCKEASPLCCHRTTLGRELAARSGLPLEDLTEDAKPLL